MNNKHYEEIPITTLANGHQVTLSVHRIVGEAPGPVLGMTALIHGDEIVPHAVLRQLHAALDPATLKGTLLMLPVANPYAYEAQSRHTPLDGVNLNRVFPGSPAGLFSEQIADAIATQFVPELDYLVDFHGGGVFPTVDYVYLSKLQPEMSLAFGSHLLYDGPGYVGTLSGLAEDQGTPTVVVEIGGGLLLDDQYLARGLQGAVNVMRHLGMLEGEPVLPETQITVTEMAVIRPKYGGALYPEVHLDRLGEVMPGGTVLGRVISPYTFEELEVLKAPFDRNYMILLRGAIARTNPGDFGFMCANADVA